MGDWGGGVEDGGGEWIALPRFPFACWFQLRYNLFHALPDPFQGILGIYKCIALISV